MSISLVVIRLETAVNSPQAKYIEFQAPKVLSSQAESKLLSHSLGENDWPLLVTDSLLNIHRGVRKTSQISITTLEQAHIADVLSAGIGEVDPVELSSVSMAEHKRDKNVTCDKEFPLTAGKSVLQPSDDAATWCIAGTKRLSPFKDSWDSVKFSSGNPTVEIVEGILHLYKENVKTSLEEGVLRSDMLCMLAVPTGMSLHELLNFTTPLYSNIQHMRVINDPTPNQYMVLIKFVSQADADMFYSTFNGQPFNSLESEVCRLLYVAKIETTTESAKGGLPIPGHTELPICPVCLERMDESVVTILCNHSFHGECLAKWGDTSCPVCRYCQTPEEAPDQLCLSCGSCDSLWICLVCGHVGCGRYVGGHAHGHFLETNHLFALQVGNNRVWDYVRDNYVHRLLQTEGDGKMVSYERSSQSSAANNKDELLADDEKLTSMQLEFTTILSLQLESQRKFFEEKINQFQDDMVKMSNENVKNLDSFNEELSRMKEELQNEKRESKIQDKKIMQLNVKLNKLTVELENEREMNISLLAGKKEIVTKMVHLQKTLDDKNKEILELESQMQDIMTHMDAMATVSQNPELQGGDVAINQSKGARRKSKK